MNLVEARVQRTLAHLKHLDDTQSLATADEGILLSADDVPEMLNYTGQRLLRADTRRIDVADAVTRHDHAALVLGLELDSHIVDLELLFWIQIVPHGHLFRAADRDPANFDRRHPAQVKMRNHLRAKVHGDVCDIG